MKDLTNFPIRYDVAILVLLESFIQISSVILFNDDYALGKSDDLYVSDYAYKSLLEHYENNWKGNSTVKNKDIGE